MIRSQPRLDERHHRYCLARGLSPAYAEAAGLYSGSALEVATALSRFGRDVDPDRVSAGIIIPYCNPDLEDWLFARVRLDEGPKFLGPAGVPVEPYVPPLLWESGVLERSDQAVCFAEGPIKALALTEAGFPTIGLGGCYVGGHDTESWKKRRDPILHSTLRNWGVWEGRRVVVIMDANRQVNPNVAEGEALVVECLVRAGADVRVAELPLTDDGKDQGPDDYLGAAGPDALRNVIEHAVPADPRERPRKANFLDLPSGAMAYLFDRYASPVTESSREFFEERRRQQSGSTRPMTAAERRLRVQLRNQRPTATVKLSESEEVLAGYLRDALEEQSSLVAQVSLGAGKTRAALWVLRQVGKGLIGVPTHELAQDVFDRLGSEHAQYRMGVVRGGCLVPAITKPLEASGGSVPTIACPSCPKRRVCTATENIGEGEVIVTVHSMLPAQNRVDGPWFIDETPELLSEVRVKNLSEAARILRAELEAEEPILRLEYLRAMRRFVEILSHVEYDSRRDSTPSTSKEIYEASWNSGFGDIWSNAVYLLEVGDRLRESDGLVELAHRPDLDHGIEPGFEYVRATPQQRERLTSAIRVLGPIRQFAWCIAGRSEESERATPVRWPSKIWRGTHNVIIGIGLTAVGRKLMDQPAIFLDATPDLATLRLLKPDVGHVNIVVEDAVEVVRIARYFPDGAKPKLVGETGATKLLQAFEEGLEILRAEGCRKVLVGTHQDCCAILEASSALEDWMKTRGTMTVRHYWAIRGLDEFKDFDGFLTVGDPWRNLGQLRRQAELTDGDPNPDMRRFAAYELAQFHGRSRAPTRSTRAVLIHFGQVAPSDWHDLNTDVRLAPSGRPKTPQQRRSASAEEIRGLVEAIGGRREAAKAARVAIRTVDRWRKGDTIPSGDFVERLRLHAKDRKPS